MRLYDIDAVADVVDKLTCGNTFTKEHKLKAHKVNRLCDIFGDRSRINPRSRPHKKRGGTGKQVLTLREIVKSEIVRNDIFPKLYLQSIRAHVIFKQELPIWYENRTIRRFYRIPGLDEPHEI